MAERKDPTFQEEESYLSYTKKYMEMILQEAQQRLDKYKGDVQLALQEMDDKESSLGYTSALSNARFLEMAMKEVGALSKVKDKPYFARIDFKRTGQQLADVYYLGKTSLYEKDSQEPIIVDWRSPVANVYYDGRLGEMSYESYEGEIAGFLSLKRQFMIEEGRLQDFVDVDMMAADELLLEALSGKADQRLTEIITTIQAEQNRVIRADLNKPIIVQGAAGSGKTTIALHRLSYFIYRYRDKFEPKQLMIMAPNQMFIGYIAEVLPELGVENIRQTTFIEYVLKSIKGKVKVLKPEEKLLKLVHHEYEDETMIKWLSQFKGSLSYKKLLDRYLQNVKKELTPAADFYLEKFRLVTGKRLSFLFLRDYQYLPYYKRLEKIKNVLRTDVRQKKKLIVDKLEKKYEDLLDRALLIKNDQMRKEKVVAVMDTKKERLNEIQKSSKTVVNNFMKLWPKESLMSYYKRLFNDHESFVKYADGLMTEEQMAYFQKYNQKLLSKNEVEIEDLAALYYMQDVIFGIDKELQVKNVVIDEAQDYSVFQLYALKTGLGTDMFTIVGDLAQGIHSYRGIESWDTLLEKVFPTANYVTLQKSYRTTVEIMNLANNLLTLLKTNLPKVEPVIRHGKVPRFYQYTTKTELGDRLVEAISESKRSGFQSIAVICKTEKECQAIFKIIGSHSQWNIQILKENEGLKPGHIVVVPTHLSKGLEFDSVIVATYNEVYEEDELDIKLLYVAMTRPMHQLSFIAKNNSQVLLDRMDQSNFKVQPAQLAT